MKTKGVIALADLPANLRDTEILAQAVVDEVIEFGRPDHSWSLTDHKKGRELIVHTSWSWTRLNGPCAKTLPDLLDEDEILAKEVDRDIFKKIRLHVRITTAGMAAI